MENENQKVYLKSNLLANYWFQKVGCDTEEMK